MLQHDAFLAPVSREIWEQKYRFKVAPEGEGVGALSGDADLEATFRRVADAAASVESGRKTQAAWSQRFFDAISDFGFLPAGRILAGAGTGREVTLFNCFVMGRIEDDLVLDFRQRQGSRAHDAARRRDRPRFLDPAPERRPRPFDRR